MHVIVFCQGASSEQTSWGKTPPAKGTQLAHGNLLEGKTPIPGHELTEIERQQRSLIVLIVLLLLFDAFNTNLFVTNKDALAMLRQDIKSRQERNLPCPCKAPVSCTP